MSSTSLVSKLREEMRVDVMLASHRHAKARASEEESALANARKEEEHARKAQDILQRLAEEVQTTVHRQVAAVVSRCLTAVFEEPYELRIEFDRKRGKTEATFVFYKSGNRVLPRVTSGAARQVVGLALRVVSLLMSNPPRRRLLILDEPFRGLSKENLQKMALLLEALSRELDMQFIVCTHDEELMIGEVVRL